MTLSVEAQKRIYQAGSKNLVDFSILTDKTYKPAWVHEEIANQLMRIDSGEIKRLMLFVPPRIGKSQLGSINFPAYYLGRHPEKEVIVASYSAELAQDFGFKTRNLVNEESYQHIFNTRLRDDSQSKSKWLTADGGGYTAVGVGGAITGRGADCFPAGTLIRTDKGNIPIETCNNRTRVLSYNHERNLPQYKQVKASLKKVKRRFVEITTISGHKVTSTDTHPIFVIGKGYVKAKELKEGQRVRVLQREEVRNSYLYAMQERVYKRLE